MIDRNSSVNILMKKLSEDQKIKNLIVTMGSQGSTLYNKKTKTFFHNEAYTKNAVDKIGAGDTMLALTSICLYKKTYRTIIFSGRFNSCRNFC